MGDRDDDLEFERSDLRTGRVADSLPAARRAGAGAADGDGHGRVPAATGAATAEGTPATGTADRAAWCRAARLFASRRVRGYAVAGFVLLVCAGLLLSLPGMPQALQQALAGPTPSPTARFVPGANPVYFEQTVPWGRFTLDGTPLEPLFGNILSLRPGRHTLTYVAAPWAPLRCQLSVPAQQGDTCPVNGHAQYDIEPLARVVDLGATPERLPEAQRAALTATVASAFQAYVETTAVLPGDHYRGADGLIAVATRPLRASLALTLNTDATRAAPQVAPAPSPCVSLCGARFGEGGGTAWSVIWAHVVAHWQFVAADGTRVEPGASTDVDAGYPVGATWSGTWSVTLHPYPGSHGALCQPAIDRAFPDGKPLPSNAGFSERIYLGPDDVEGCVEIVSLNSSSSGGGSSGSADAAIFIARLGMVLAGNGVAHTAQPLLPVASAHERALAQQWMAQG